MRRFLFVNCLFANKLLTNDVKCIKINFVDIATRAYNSVG